MIPEPRVRIVSDGDGYHTRVLVDGTEIPASHITWRVDAQGIATATLVVPYVALDAKAREVLATIATDTPPALPELPEARRLAPLQPGGVP